MNVYCIGIGGIGVSGVARFLKREGHHVSGSDTTPSVITKGLEEDGISVFLDQSGKNINKEIDIIVYSVAIPDEHAELQEARKLGIPVYTYAQALGELSRQYDTIAVCGTHGKTTTSGMLYSAFLSQGLSPSALVGSLMKDFGGVSTVYGTDNTLILESCEYRRNFSFLEPKHVLVTNIEFDHADFYQTEDHYFRAFKSFLSKVPPAGIIVMKTEDSVKVGADYFRAKVVFYDSFIEKLTKKRGFSMKVFGKHNLANAACVYAFANEIGLEEKKILQGLQNFSGTWRRMEFKGGLRGAEVYDDYAHHPSEVRATLAAFREKYPNKKIRVVFQPHQYSRTQYFLSEFARSFDNADEVIIPNIYRVRDSDFSVSSVSADDLVSEISAMHKNVRHGNGLGDTARYLNETAKDNEVIVVMGAGDVTKVCENLEIENMF